MHAHQHHTTQTGIEWDREAIDKTSEPKHYNALKQQALMTACEETLKHAYSNFCFDKICYWACGAPPVCKHILLDSKHMAYHHNCGNCYAFALFIQKHLKQSHGIDSVLIAGNVPVYFMRPAYDAVCHAAVYVPSARLILDPSIYAPPIPVTFGGAIVTDIKNLPVCKPSKQTIMGKHADLLTASAQFMHSPYRFINPVNEGKQCRIPARTYKVTVQLHKYSKRGDQPAPTSSYTYFLRSINNFDESVTRQVHTKNTSLFRQDTKKDGSFQYRLNLLGNNTANFVNYTKKTEKKFNLEDNNWLQSFDVTEQAFLENMKYCYG